MSLHNEIMNIQQDLDSLQHFTGQSHTLRAAYKFGHEDARHAAAELSLKYERALEEATKALKQLSYKSDDDNVRRFAKGCVLNLELILEGK